MTVTVALCSLLDVSTALFLGDVHFLRVWIQYVPVGLNWDTPVEFSIYFYDGTFCWKWTWMIKYDSASYQPG